MSPCPKMLFAWISVFCGFYFILRLMKVQGRFWFKHISYFLLKFLKLLNKIVTILQLIKFIWHGNLNQPSIIKVDHQQTNTLLKLFQLIVIVVVVSTNWWLNLFIIGGSIGSLNSFSKVFSLAVCSVLCVLLCVWWL